LADDDEGRSHTVVVLSSKRRVSLCLEYLARGRQIYRVNKESMEFAELAVINDTYRKTCPQDHEDASTRVDRY
jgi:hypothetical protein